MSMIWDIESAGKIADGSAEGRAWLLSNAQQMILYHARELEHWKSLQVRLEHSSGSKNTISDAIQRGYSKKGTVVAMTAPEPADVEPEMDLMLRAKPAGHRKRPSSLTAPDSFSVLSTFSPASSSQNSTNSSPIGFPTQQAPVFKKSGSAALISELGSKGFKKNPANKVNESKPFVIEKPIIKVEKVVDKEKEPVATDDVSSSAATSVEQVPVSSDELTFEATVKGTLALSIRAAPGQGILITDIKANGAAEAFNNAAAPGQLKFAIHDVIQKIAGEDVISKPYDDAKGLLALHAKSNKEFTVFVRKLSMKLSGSSDAHRNVEIDQSPAAIVAVESPAPAVCVSASNVSDVAVNPSAFFGKQSISSSISEAIQHEIGVLSGFIQRIGKLDEKQQYTVTFSQIFRDDEIANTFESLAGTLKAGKKQKIFHYSAELLLQGKSDDDVITLLNGVGDSVEKSSSKKDGKVTKPTSTSVPIDTIPTIIADKNDAILAETNHATKPSKKSVKTTCESDKGTAVSVLSESLPASSIRLKKTQSVPLAPFGSDVTLDGPPASLPVRMTKPLVTKSTESKSTDDSGATTSTPRAAKKFGAPPQSAEAPASFDTRKSSDDSALPSKKKIPLGLEGMLAGFAGGGPPMSLPLRKLKVAAPAEEASPTDEISPDAFAATSPKLGMGRGKKIAAAAVNDVLDEPPGLPPGLPGKAIPTPGGRQRSASTSVVTGMRSPKKSP